MKLKDIAATAAGILQADDILLVLNTATEPQDYGSDSDTECMLLCADLAVKEACADGFPVLREVQAVAENKRIPLSFIPDASSVKSVIRYGRRVPFSVDTRGIAVSENGPYTVVYAVEPPEYGQDDEVSVGVFADKTLLGYLAARDYCLITGRTDEAAIWDQRYVTESERKRLMRRARLPMREWR